MTASKKIKTINNKIYQNKSQNNLNRQTARISVLLSGNIGKYEFVNWQRSFTRKRTSRKSCYNQKT